MARAPTLRWLHLSDLRLAAGGGGAWASFAERFFESVRAHAERFGPPDLVFLSGSLAAAGTNEDYQEVERFLARLRREIDGATSMALDPCMIAVPGDSDVVVLGRRELAPYAALDRYGSPDDEQAQYARDRLWQDRDYAYLAFTRTARLAESGGDPR